MWKFLRKFLNQHKPQPVTDRIVPGEYVTWYETNGIANIKFFTSKDELCDHCATLAMRHVEFKRREAA